MTRPPKGKQPAAANRNGRTAASAPSKPAMQFLVFEDNAGGYHWTIVSDSGKTLAQSTSFATHEQAKQAARTVHDGAGSASLEPLTRGRQPTTRDTPPAEPVHHPNASHAARRGWHETTRAAPPDPETQRWLDEGLNDNAAAR